MEVSIVTDLPLVCPSVWFVLGLSHGCVEWKRLAVSCSLQWNIILFVEAGVPSSGETWQAKLIGIVVISVAQG